MSSWASDSSGTRTFFDQGLFLLHLNRGKEEMRRGQYDSARREFEAAQQFRPHDPDVVSNLSFSLFHLGNYEDAERITRGLLSSHPDSVPLLFNLGLILFKTERHVEAQEPLRRVLDIVPAHRKSHLTLGLIFQRAGDLLEAKRHFRLAGAELKEGSTADDTISRTARTAGASRKLGETSPIVKPESLESTPPPKAASPEVPKETTGKVKTLSMAETLETGEVEVVGGVQLKPASSPQKPVYPARKASSATSPLLPKTSPRRETPVVVPAESISNSTRETFRSEAGGFLTAGCQRGLYVRRGVLSGREGTPTFEVDRQLEGALSQLLIHASGEGELLLVDRGRRPFLKALANEFLSVEPGRLLAFDASLRYREDPAFEFRRHIAVPFLKLFGSGIVALSVLSEPALFPVSVRRPLTLAARAVLAYGGDVVPELLEESDPLASLGSGPVFRFVGSGYVLAEAS